MKLSTRSLRDDSMQSRLAMTPVLLVAVLALPACLGGDAKPAVDAGMNGQVDANPDMPDAAPEVTCATVMQGAPTGAAAIPFADALETATANTWDSTSIPGASEATYPGGKYRTLTADGAGNIHPGCSTEGLDYTAATIPDYPCAAKEYAFPDGVTEDTTKPIVILVHGNSDSPDGFEAYLHPDPASLGFPADTETRDQLAELLPAAGYRTITVDMRIDLVDDSPSAAGGNIAKNIDHGWAVPIAQELIKQVIIANPDRKVSIVGFSLGATVVRDALRRLFAQNQDGAWDINVFSRLQDVIVASGAHHGVKTFADLCGKNTTMSGTVTCEMGQRNTYTQTAFHEPLNGPSMFAAGQAFGGWYETPCADGDYAFGLRGACGGNAVQYTTITMADIESGTQQDEFVSEHASRLYPIECANNIVTDMNDFDTSGYFYNGALRNHFGAVRSAAGLVHMTTALAD